MDVLHDFLLSYYFLAFIIAWILSVFIKSIISSVRNKRPFRVKDGFNNGGMPSSHSAVVASITTALLLKTGFSEIFFVSLVFSLLVISDAFIVRKNVGLQGDTINGLLKRSGENPISVVYGHSFMQVIAGIVLGVACSAILYVLI